MTTQHSHPADLAKNEAVTAVVEMRTHAVQGMEKPRQVILNSTRGISLDAARKLPTYKASQRAIERIRKKTMNHYSNLTTVAEINISDVLRTTQRNDNFVMWDSGPQDAKPDIWYCRESQYS